MATLWIAADGGRPW